MLNSEIGGEREHAVVCNHIQSQIVFCLRRADSSQPCVSTETKWSAEHPVEDRKISTSGRAGGRAGGERQG